MGWVDCEIFEGYNYIHDFNVQTNSRVCFTCSTEKNIIAWEAVMLWNKTVATIAIVNHKHVKAIFGLKIYVKYFNVFQL